MLKTSNLKKIFANDPEMLRILEGRENERVSLSFLKGEDGKTPKKGVDYFTDGELAEVIKAATPVRGKDYFTKEDIDDIRRNVARPRKGVDYFTPSEVKKFIELATPVKGKHYFDGMPGKPGKHGRSIRGKDGSPDLPEEIAQKLNTLTAAVNAEAIKGIKEMIEEFFAEVKKKRLISRQDIAGMPLDMSDQRWHGGGLSTVSHDATLTGDGTPSSPLSVVGAASFSILAATGTIDDSNLDFTFASLPIVLVINGGVYQQTGGAITWSWNAGLLTATLSSPVGSGGSIFGLA